MSGTPTLPPKRPRPRVLVVDDEAHLADGIRENLEAEGYIADVAHDGVAGLERIRRERYDLILLDVMMPKMDGVALCAAIRAEGVQTPVVFLTVKGEPEDRIRGLEAGGGAGRNVHVVVRVAVRYRGHLPQLRAAQPQRVLFFLRLGVRHQDQRSITARVADQR